METKQNIIIISNKNTSKLYRGASSFVRFMASKPYLLLVVLTLLAFEIMLDAGALVYFKTNNTKILEIAFVFFLIIAGIEILLSLFTIACYIILGTIERHSKREFNFIQFVEYIQDEKHEPIGIICEGYNEFVKCCAFLRNCGLEWCTSEPYLTKKNELTDDVYEKYDLDHSEMIILGTDGKYIIEKALFEEDDDFNEYYNAYITFKQINEVIINI